MIIIRAGKAISSVYISETRFKKMHRLVDLNGVLVTGFQVLYVGFHKVLFVALSRILH